MKDIYSLLITNEFSNLLEVEKEIVLGEMSEEDYSTARRALLSSQLTQNKQLHVKADVKRNLDAVFESRFRNKSYAEVERSNANRHSSFYKRYKVLESVLFIALLMLGYFGMQIIQNSNSEEMTHSPAVETLNLQSIDEIIINAEMCLDAELVMPDIYDIPATHDLVRMDFQGQ